jgi:hypothetical protein
MFALDRRQQSTLAVVLAVLMALTRSHHFATLGALPDASWAVFFATGLYLRGRWVFPAFFALAAAVDAYAILVAGVSEFCVTSAYLFLLPAYGALWAGGRWYSHRVSASAGGLVQLSLAVAVAAFSAEFLASGSFYFLGGRFDEVSLAGFLPRLAEYFPRSLGVMSFYVAIGTLLHALTATLATRHASQHFPRR